MVSFVRFDHVQFAMTVGGSHTDDPFGNRLEFVAA